MRKSFLYILCFAVACQLIGCGSGEEQRLGRNLLNVKLFGELMRTDIDSNDVLASTQATVAKAEG